MDKKKRTRELIVFAVIVLALLAGTAADPRSRKRKRAALKRTDAQKIERKKISSQPKGSSIFLLLW